MYTLQTRLDSALPGRKQNVSLHAASGPGRRIALSFAVLLLLVTGVRAARAQDGRAILQKVSDAYYHLKTYQGTASVESSSIYQGKILKTNVDQVEMKFMRPNFILLTFSNPNGTRIITSDGKNLYFLNVALNQYLKMPAEPDTKRLIAQLGLFQITAIADPLYFLGFKGVPPTLSTISAPVSRNYNGKPVYLVTGVTKTGARTIRAKNGQLFRLPAAELHWKWWINRKTFLLEKMEAEDYDARLPVVVQQGKKMFRQVLRVTQRVRHIVLTAQPDAPLNARSFAFTPPPGAGERKSVADLLKTK